MLLDGPSCRTSERLRRLLRRSRRRDQRRRRRRLPTLRRLNLLRTRRRSFLPLRRRLSLPQSRRRTRALGKRTSSDATDVMSWSTSLRALSFSHLVNREAKIIVIILFCEREVKRKKKSSTTWQVH